VWDDPVVESGGGPAFSAERTRVSGRRFVAHVVDGTLYVIALIGMLTSEYRQRFGDRWGRTYVVLD
jgi:hypothetical protein